MKMGQKNYSQGIGLLELMLSLAIIALLLIMATRYFTSASMSQKVSLALDEFSAVKSAVKQYYVTNHASGTAYAIPTIAKLVQEGYLPNSYINQGSSGANAKSTYTNPWGGAISLAAGDTANTFVVTMDGVPANACEQVVPRIYQSISPAAGESMDPADTSKCSTSIAVTYSYG